ncbi:MAG: hypothetical protein NVSMB3_01340 [Acidobacteriaceae bacterium]
MVRRLRVMRRVAAFVVLLCAVRLGVAEGEGVFKNVFWQPNELQQGSVVFFTVELESPAKRVSGTLLGKELTFFRGEKPEVWYALGGVDMEAAPGSYDLAVRAVSVKGRVSHTTKKVEVGSGNFKEGSVEVPQNFVTPDDAAKRQIALDQVAKNRAYAHLLATPQWSGEFIKPVAAPETESFGMTRLYNEELTSQHRGTDFPVKEGAPVVASNAGTVVLAKELFYEGNCVIVDHGQHFMTIYMHLSKIDVKVGDRLKKEQRLGLSGATGRVTGPHLHMGVRWNGAYLNPTKLVELTLPESHTVAGPKREHGPVKGSRRRSTRSRSH